MGAKPSTHMTEQLLKILDNCGLTRYQIAKATGISESTLAQFYNGQRGLSMEALNALSEFLKLRITFRRKPEKKGK